MILHYIVGSSGQRLRDFRPFVPEFPLCLEYNFLLFVRKWLLLHLWVQMIMPPIQVNINTLPFATLFARSATNMIFVLEFLGYKRPLSDAVVSDQVGNSLILLFGPQSTREAALLFL